MEKSLVDRIEVAAERSCIISVLSDAQQVIGSRKICQGSRRSILETLLNQMKPAFLGLLTKKEFQLYYVNLFANSPTEDALFAIVQCLRLPSDFYKFQHVISLLNVVEERGFKQLFLQSISSAVHLSADTIREAYQISKNVMSISLDQTSALHYELSHLILQIPDLLYNAMGNSADRKKDTADQNVQSFLANHYFYLLDAVKGALLSARERVEQKVDVNLKFVAAVLPAIFRGSSETFGRLISWLETRESSVIWERLNSRLFTDQSNGILFTEDIVLHVAIAAKDGTSLFKLFGEELIRNRIVKKILFYKMLLVKVFDQNALIPQKLSNCINVGCGYETEDVGPWSALYVETTLNILNAWSDSVHLIHSSDEQRHYVDSALLWLVKNANEKVRAEVSRKVNEYLIPGIEAHLSCADMHRRFRGMYIAETLTKFLSLGDLTFDYPDESSGSLRDLRDIVENRFDVPKEVDHVTETGEGICKQVLVNANDIYATESNAAIDSDDDEFPAYEIPISERNIKIGDEISEGQMPVRAPHYIRDCLEDLNEQESFAKFEAAFGVLNSLIRSRALAYDEVAPDLVKKLIFLTDRYKTERFQERRLEMVVSCLVMSPQLVSVVADIMFSRSCSMFGRYLILDAVSKAATEISNSGDEHFNASSSKSKSGSSGLKSWQLIIQERVAAKTKYHGKQAKVQKFKKNEFSDLAPSFFYPLAAIEQYREHLDLLHRDYKLLAKILFVLANIISCAENCPPTPRMAKTLSNYAVSLQRHKESMVRQAVLYCYCSICIALSTPVLLQFFSDALSDWFHYAVNVNDTDPSITCREMAECASSIIASKIKTTEIHNM